MKNQLTRDIVDVAPDIKFAADEAVNFLLRAGLSKSAIKNPELINPRVLTAHGRKRSEHVAAAAELLYWEREFAGAIAGGRTSELIRPILKRCGGVVGYNHAATYIHRTRTGPPRRPPPLQRTARAKV